MNEVPVWVRHILLIIPSINIEVLPEAEESLWDKIREITRMIGFVKILSVLCDFFSAFLGRGGAVDILGIVTNAIVAIFVRSF